MKKHIITAMAIIVAALPAMAQNTDWQQWNTANSGIPSNAITAMEVNDLGTWIGTEDGLARLEGQLWPEWGHVTTVCRSQDI